MNMKFPCQITINKYDDDDDDDDDDDKDDSVHQHLTESRFQL